MPRKRLSSDMGRQFALTMRECETVTLLLEELASKEIAY